MMMGRYCMPKEQLTTGIVSAASAAAAASVIVTTTAIVEGHPATSLEIRVSTCGAAVYIAAGTRSRYCRYRGCQSCMRPWRGHCG
jgi:hypothetical protein